ncbi:hypothetical protein CLOM_g19115 [Closterium sp. NIES-68]|nr:hypothetical protein CLOM_g19115 [Closterium sp. NIES-68]
MDKVIPKLDTFPEDGDLSIIGKKTILIPQNEALGAVGVGSLVKNGTSPEQIVTFLEMGLLHILDGYYPFREIKHSSSVPTLLPGRRLRKYFVPLLMRRGSPYALGQSWNGLSWSQIVNPGIYRGKYIVVHGVDALQQP